MKFPQPILNRLSLRDRTVRALKKPVSRQNRKSPKEVCRPLNYVFLIFDFLRRTEVLIDFLYKKREVSRGVTEEGDATIVAPWGNPTMGERVPPSTPGHSPTNICEIIRPTGGFFFFLLGI
jgi:hypothetical protein